jgi:hypothetical protein
MLPCMYRAVVSIDDARMRVFTFFTSMIDSFFAPLQSFFAHHVQELKYFFDILCPYNDASREGTFLPQSRTNLIPNLRKYAS